jgi:hypothetical protein
MAQRCETYAKEILTETSFEIVKAVSEYLRSIPDVEFLNNNCLKDVVLEKDNLIGELDYLFINEEKAVIVDLKTSENISKRSFF